MTIRGLTPAPAITAPFSAPPSTPTTIGRRKAQATLAGVGSLWANCPETIPAIASSEPTDRSMPAVMMVNVIPIAMMPMTDTCRRISAALSQVRNSCTRSEK